MTLLCKDQCCNTHTHTFTVLIRACSDRISSVRTDLSFTREDGSTCLYFDPVHFAAFEVHILQREGAMEVVIAADAEIQPAVSIEC